MKKCLAVQCMFSYKRYIVICVILCALLSICVSAVYAEPTLFVEGVGVPNKCVVGDKVDDVLKKINTIWNIDGFLFSDLWYNSKNAGSMAVSSIGKKVKSIRIHITTSTVLVWGDIKTKTGVPLNQDTSLSIIMKVYGCPAVEINSNGGIKNNERNIGKLHKYLWKNEIAFITKYSLEVGKIGTEVAYPSISTYFRFINDRLVVIGVDNKYYK